MTEKEKEKAYDKKIREAILNGLIDCRDAPDLGWSNFGGIHIDDCIAWLEKQGEQASSQTNERAWLYLVSDVLTWKDGIGQYLDDPRVQELAKKLCSEYAQKLYNPSVLLNSPNTEKNEQKSANKIEPRFKVGDWVVQNYNLLKIRYVGNEYYSFETVDAYVDYMLVSEIDSLYHLWTIQDAKVGDVLEFEDHGRRVIGILSYINKTTGKVDVSCLLECNKFKVGVFYNLDTVKPHPVTKEQRDLLFQKIKESGYKWNIETKTLEKLEKSSFHEGDWVVRGDTIAQILDIQEQYYNGLDINGKDFVSSRFLNSDKIHLWTIQDAKDGDFLCCKSGWMCIFKSLNNHTNTFSSYCFMDSDKCFFNNGGECHTLDKEFILAYNGEIHPATKEQRDLLFQKIKEAGYKWNTETKTLEKLVEPKFKVGDKIVNLPMKYMGGSWTQGTISKITDDKYIFTDGSYTSISSQDSWELVLDKKSKFDQKSLKPFDKVLARYNSDDMWKVDFYSHKGVIKTYPYRCIGSPYTYCIPYNDDTKHIVGTTDEAPEYYRYWED